MHFSSLIKAASLASSALAITVTYNKLYDDPSLPIASLSCSNAFTKSTNSEFSTIGDLPLPIMGIVAIEDARSDACMTCWELHYPALRQSIKVLAMDGAANGVVLSLETMNALTHGRVVELGSIEVEAVEVPLDSCGTRDHIGTGTRRDRDIKSQYTV